MSKKLLKVVLVVLLIISVAIVLFLHVSKKNIVFKLNGSPYIRIELNQEYIDEGVTATIFKKNISTNVKSSNNINTSKIGKYTISYSLSFLGYSNKLKRKIEVVDSVPPTIELIGESKITIHVGDDYTEKGATATDNYDGDLTESIYIENLVDSSKEGIYQVKYNVTDSSNNKSSIVRIVSVEKKKEIKKPKKTPAPVSYDYNNPIIKHIKDNNYDVSIGYYNLVTGKQFFYREGTIYYGASLIKTLDAIYLYENDMVNDEIREYIEKAISKSDNDSHHYLLDYIGRDNLKKYGKSLGAKNTLTTKDRYCGNTTVKDQLIYWKKLYEITENNEELKSFFINNYGNFIKINDLVTMHKYGYYGEYFHDVGIIFDDEPYIVIILTKHAKDDRQKIINDISKVIYDYHKGDN